MALEKREITAIVLGSFFLAFLLFLLFEPSLTGDVALAFSGQQNNFLEGKTINPPVMLTLDVTDSIPDSAELSMKIGDKFSGTKKISEILSSISPPLTCAAGKCSAAGPHTIDTAVFGAVLTNIVQADGKPVPFTLEISLKDGGNNLVNPITMPIFIIKDVFLDYPNITGGMFSPVRVDDKKNIEKYYKDFSAGDTLLCSANYTKGFDSPVLTFKFYKPGDSISAPTRTIISTSSDAVCGAYGNVNYCNAFYKVNNSARGQWSCVVSASNSKGSSLPFTVPGVAVMVGSVPKLVKGIPILNCNDTIKLSEHFSDADGDEVKYKLSGFKVITPTITGDVLSFSSSGDATEDIELIVYDLYTNLEDALSEKVTVTCGKGEGATGACAENWEYGEWSACVDGIQVRTATDANSCGTTASREPLEQRCAGGGEGSASVGTNESGNVSAAGSESTSSSGGGGFLIVLLVVIFALVLGGGLVFILKMNKPKKKEEEEEEEEEKKEEKPRVDDRPLKRYVKWAAARNASAKEMKDNLLKKGWDKDAVENAVNIEVLKKYVSGKVGKGVDKGRVRVSLETKGWKKEVLDEVFSE